MRFRVGFTIVVLLATGLASAQAGDDANLATGRQFVAELKLDQTADQVLFERIGLNRASVLLNAVMSRGQAVTATPLEWAEMHRAIAGLIEVSVAKSEWFKAAILATAQDIYYRNCEGDYAAALAAARQALDLQNRSGETSTLYISWQNIGENLIHLGRIDEGIEALYEAHRRIDDKTSPASATLSRQIVNGEMARGNLEAARRECDVFVRLAEGPSPALFRGRALLSRAALEMEQGRYQAALNDVGAARLAMANDPAKLDFDDEAAEELLSMVLTAMSSVPYSEAMALARRTEVEFPDLPFPVAAYAQGAMNYRRRLAGQFDALLREDAVALEEARQAKNIPSQIEALRSQSVTYAFVNDKRRAIVLLEEALELERSTLPADGVPVNAGSQYSHFRLLASLGGAYADNQQITQARQCFDEITRSLDELSEGAARGRLGRIYAEAELGKALVAEIAGDSAIARDILHKALDGSGNGPIRFTRSAVLLQAARLERNLNEHPLEAVRYYEEAIQALHAEKDIRTEIATRLQLARYLAVEGAQAIPDAQGRAAQHLALAATAAGAIEFADAEWRVRFLQGVVAENAMRTEEAILLYQQAVDKLDHLRAGLSQQEQRQAFMDSVAIAELYQRLIGLLTAVGRNPQAWEYLERSKARSFLEMLQGRRFRGASTTAATQKLDAVEQQTINLRTQLAPGNTAALRTGTEPALLHAQLRDLEARFTADRQEAALRGSRTGQELSLSPLRIPEVQAKLPAGIALIEYALLRDGLTAFVITRESIAQAVWHVNFADLRVQVENARELLARPDSANEIGPVLEKISAVVMQPVLAKVPAGTRALLIVPADVLNYLPFQALPLGGGQVLLDRFTIAYLPSASALAFIAPVNSLKGTLFLGAIGNLSVDGKPRLPGSLREVRSIAVTYPASRLALEKAFTYDRLRKALLEDDAVHLATHGVLDSDSPLFDAVITSPAPNRPSRLSLYELTDMQLRARLIVLSACDTALGQLQRGDEITGLSRVLLQAGADAVVASLWSVSDRATALLMTGFYQRLHAGQSPAEALRRSALSVRKRFPHPYYWAPFVVTGAL